MKAATDGNTEEAAFLFRVHSRMIIPTPTRSNVTDNLREVATTDVGGKVDNQKENTTVVPEEELEEPFIENGITFLPG